MVQRVGPAHPAGRGSLDGESVEHGQVCTDDHVGNARGTRPLPFQEGLVRDCVALREIRRVAPEQVDAFAEHDCVLPIALVDQVTAGRHANLAVELPERDLEGRVDAGLDLAEGRLRARAVAGLRHFPVHVESAGRVDRSAGVLADIRAPSVDRVLPDVFVATAAGVDAGVLHEVRARIEPDVQIERHVDRLVARWFGDPRDGGEGLPMLAERHGNEAAPQTLALSPGGRVFLETGAPALQPLSPEARRRLAGCPTSGQGARSVRWRWATPPGNSRSATSATARRPIRPTAKGSRALCRRTSSGRWRAPGGPERAPPDADAVAAWSSRSPP